MTKRIDEIKERLQEISEFIEMLHETIDRVSKDEKGVYVRQLDDYESERIELLVQLEDLES